MGAVEVILFLTALFTWLYWWSVKRYSYWEKQGVAHVKPWPLFGNSFDSIVGRMASYQVHHRNYQVLKEYPFAGTYSLRTPVLYAHRPELVEAFLIKDFAHFYNRGTKVDEDMDPFSANLVNLEDERWKTLRNKLTPVFSSGKLRFMEEKLMLFSSELLEYIKSRKGECLEAKELMSRFAMSVILGVAFGVQEDVIRNPDSVFRKLGGEFFKTNLKARIRMLLRIYAPNLLLLLRWKGVSNEAEEFFIKFIKETVKHRESTGLEGKDFLQLLINLRKEDKSSASKILSDQSNGKVETAGEKTLGQDLDNSSGVVLNDRMLIANAFVFLTAGFETTATTLSFCLFELGKDQLVQDRLHREVKEALEANGGKPTYDVIKKITYLEQVIYETLRMWPVAPSNGRVCTKDYRVPNSNIVLRKGDRIQVPTYSLHRDPKYWENPEKFNPDRFGPEQKEKIVKGTFLPFGDGPRICIGMRFAMYEMKAALAEMVMAFKVTLNSKTEVPLLMKKTAVLLVPESGIWVNFESR